MGIFSFLFGSSSIEDTSADGIMEINPANGNPMIGGMGGFDIEGNPYGTDDSINSFDDSFSSFDDSIDGFDDPF